MDKQCLEKGATASLELVNNEILRSVALKQLQSHYGLSAALVSVKRIHMSWYPVLDRIRIAADKQKARQGACRLTFLPFLPKGLATA